MTTQKISEAELSPLKISALPTRPTAPEAYGGAGMTGSELKAAFDRLPLLIVSRLNSLIDDICAEGQESVCSAIKTALSENHTLFQMFSDIRGGAFASYLSVGDYSLIEFINLTSERLSRIESTLGISSES